MIYCCRIISVQAIRNQQDLGLSIILSMLSVEMCIGFGSAGDTFMKAVIGLCVAVRRDQNDLLFLSLSF